jgi:hypothetical protein
MINSKIVNFKTLMETYKKLEIFAILRNSVEIFAILLEILKRDSTEIQKKKY